MRLCKLHVQEYTNRSIVTLRVSYWNCFKIYCHISVLPKISKTLYIRYAYKWLVRVSTHPRFLACELQAPMGAYSGEYGML